jgi:hypothetical protein
MCVCMIEDTNIILYNFIVDGLAFCCGCSLNNTVQQDAKI